MDMTPTVGFSKLEFTYKKHCITLFDLGGSKGFRIAWRNYLSEMYGIVYLVDSSDMARLEECRAVLTELLANPLVSGKPD